MPFLDHLEELRKRIIVIAVTIAVSSTALYYKAFYFLEILLRPIEPYLGGKLNVLGPFESFTFRFKVALYAALVFTSPILIWQVLAFFLPALRPKERRYFIPTFIAGVLLFIGGNAFAYYVILGPAFQWMLGQATGPVQVLPEAARFLSGITLLMLGFGLAFELPVVVFYLLLFDIVSYKKLRASWRVVYVLLMIVAAVATPDWSPVTMGALFFALIGLYEGSLGLARVMLAKRIAQQKAMGL